MSSHPQRHSRESGNPRSPANPRHAFVTRRLNRLFPQCVFTLARQKPIPYKADGSRLTPHRPDAQIAQLVEQRIENPRVAGSIPALGTTFFSDIARSPIPAPSRRHKAFSRVTARRV
jgi:hypothetical protein